MKNIFNPYAKISRYVNHNEGNLRASCEFYLEQDYVNKEELKMVSEDEWTWEDIGDNGGRIRKIRDNWYYYEAWF